MAHDIQHKLSEIAPHGPIAATPETALDQKAREAVKEHLFTAIARLKSANRTPDIDRLLSELEGMMDAAANGGNISGFRARLSNLEDNIQREVADAKEDETKNNLEIADAAEYEKESAAYARIKLSVAAQMRVSARSTPKITVGGFSGSFIDPDAPPIVQHFENTAYAAALETPQGQMQWNSYKRVLENDQPFVEKAWERSEKAKVILSELLNEHPQGELNTQLHLIQNSKLFYVPNVQKLLGDLAEGAKLSADEVQHIVETGIEHRNRFLKSNDASAKEAMRGAGPKAHHIFNEMSADDVEHCRNGVCHNSQRFAAAKANLPKLLEGNTVGMSVNEAQDAAVMAADQALEPQFSMNEVVELFNARSKVIQHTKRNSKDMKENLDVAMTASQMASITGTIGQTGKIRSTEKREENFMEIMRSDPKYAGVEWTPERLKKLKETAHKVIEGYDKHEAGFELQKVDLVSALKRGADAVLHGKPEDIGAYADMVKQAMKSSGYSEMTSGLVSAGLKVVGQTYATTVQAVKDVVHGFENMFSHESDAPKPGAPAAGALAGGLQQALGSVKAPQQTTEQGVSRLIDQVNAAQWGKSHTGDGKAIFDLNGDGKIDTKELLRKLNQYGCTAESMDMKKDGFSAADLAAAMQKIANTERTKYEAEHPSHAPSTPAGAARPKAQGHGH